MTWQQNKARKERLEKVKQNSRYLHDLFFGKIKRAPDIRNKPRPK
jgi:hypothetical protein